MAAGIQSAVNAGQTARACAQITGYLALVKAQTGKKLTPIRPPQLVRKGQRRFWRGRFGQWGLAGLRSLVMRHNHDATARTRRPRGSGPRLSTAITRTNAPCRKRCPTASPTAALRCLPVSTSGRLDMGDRRSRESS